MIEYDFRNGLNSPTLQGRVDYIYADFRSKVPSDTKELKFVIGGYVDNSFDSLLKDINLGDLLSSLTHLEHLSMNGLHLKPYLQNYEYLGTIPTLKKLEINFIKFDISFLTQLTQIEALKISIVEKKIPRVVLSLTQLKDLEIINVRESIKLLPAEHNVLSVLTNLTKLKLETSNTDVSGLIRDSNLTGLTDLSLFQSKLGNKDLDLSSLVNLKKLNLSKVRGLGNLVLPTQIEEIYAEGTRNFLNVFLEDKTYPELRVIQAPEGTHTVKFNVDTTADKRFYNSAFFRGVAQPNPNDRSSVPKIDLYLDIKAPKLEIINLKKLKLGIDKSLNVNFSEYELNIDKFTELKDLNISNGIYGIKLLMTLRNENLKRLNLMSVRINDFSVFRNYPNLEFLDIRYLTTFPTWRILNKNVLNDLVNLRELHCGKNDLGEDDYVLENLTELRILDISFNEIGDLSKVLGNGKFTNLVKLNVFGNNLVTLPEFTDGLFENLEILHVNINMISEIKPSIGNLTKLKIISLAKNRLNGLPKELLNLDLLSLKLGENIFTSYPENIELVDCIQDTPGYGGAYERSAKIKYFKDFGFAANPDGRWSLKPLKKLKDCLYREVDLDLCSDDYIPKLIEGSKVNFVWQRGYENIDGNLMRYSNDSELNDNYIRFSNTFPPKAMMFTGHEDIISLCNFDYTVVADRAIDMGGPTKEFFDKLINAKLAKNDIFSMVGNKIGINPDIPPELKTGDRSLPSFSLYAMIAGYKRGLSDFNSLFTFTHAMNLVYKYRHDYLSARNKVEIQGSTKKEIYANVLKKFAYYFLKEDKDFIKELNDDSNRLHIYAFLLAEFVDAKMIIDDTTHCKNVLDYNTSGKSNKKREYAYIFEGTEQLADEEVEDMVELATDFLVEYEITVDGDKYPILAVAEEYAEGFDDLIEYANQQMPGKWWETPENITIFQEFLEKWRRGELQMTGGGDRIPELGIQYIYGRGRDLHSSNSDLYSSNSNGPPRRIPAGSARGIYNFANPPVNNPAGNAPGNNPGNAPGNNPGNAPGNNPGNAPRNNPGNAPRNNAAGNAPRNNAAGSAPGDNGNNGGNDPVTDYNYPFMNSFIDAQIKENDFTPELLKVFDENIPISTLVGDEVLKHISNNPVKMFLLLCPKFEPPLGDIIYGLNIKNVTRFIITGDELEQFKDKLVEFFLDDRSILGDDELVREIDEVYSSGAGKFREDFDTHEKIVRKIFEFITGSKTFVRGLKMDIYNGDQFASHTCFNQLDVPRRYLKDPTDNRLLVNEPNFKRQFLKDLILVSTQNLGYGLAGIKVFKKSRRNKTQRKKSVSKGKKSKRGIGNRLKEKIGKLASRKLVRKSKGESKSPRRVMTQSQRRKMKKRKSRRN